MNGYTITCVYTQMGLIWLKLFIFSKSGNVCNEEAPRLCLMKQVSPGPQILSGVSDKFDQIILLPSNRIKSFNELQGKLSVII